MKTIKIKEEFQVPGTNVILEKGDRIQVVNEALNYPTQDSAEALVDWSNKLSEVYMGSAGPTVRQAFEAAEKIRLNIWDKIFGDNSPWSVQRGRKGYEVIWDNFKAEKLGL